MARPTMIGSGWSLSLTPSVDELVDEERERDSERDGLDLYAPEDDEDEDGLTLVKCLSMLELFDGEGCSTDGGNGEDDAFSVPLGLEDPSILLRGGGPVGGMHRVSSCYFSLASSGSAADPLQLLESEDGANNGNGDAGQDRRPPAEVMVQGGNGGDAASVVDAGGTAESSMDAVATSDVAPGCAWSATDILYHDIMTRVFAFLDAPSMRSFSETARRPNFEAFYFFELQLQRAMLLDEPRPAPACTSHGESTAPAGHDDDALISVAGSGIVSRLAALDAAAARSIVQAYLDSNSTLRALPLSHSLAYLRHALRRYNNGRSTTPPSLPHLPHMALNLPDGVAARARAVAVLVTFLGAASYVGTGGEELRDALFKLGLAGSIMKAGAETAKKVASGSTPAESAVAAAPGSWTEVDSIDGDGTAESDVFDAGVVGESSAGSQPAAANGGPPVRREQERRMSPSAFSTSIAARLYAAFQAAATAPTDGAVLSHLESADASSSDNGVDQELTHSSVKGSNGIRSRRVRGQRTRVGTITGSVEDDDASTMVRSDSDDTANNDADGGVRNPLSSTSSAQTITSAGQKEDQTKHPGCSSTTDQDMTRAMAQPVSSNPYDHLMQSTRETGESPVSSTEGKEVSGGSPSKLPSGCIGAYTRAVRTATKELTRQIKERRKANFEALPEGEKSRISTVFIDACTSDDTLSIVKDLLQRQNLIDVDGFFVGSDGTETCALHAATFNGANEVVDFLCGGVDEVDEARDGGLCDVDMRDANGWTALHFAAGANNVSAVRIIAGHGAKLTTEATNGYTPFHWAQRLSNQEVADELQQLGADERFGVQEWFRPSFLTSRFFTQLVPTN